MVSLASEPVLLIFMLCPRCLADQAGTDNLMVEFLKGILLHLLAVLPNSQTIFALEK